MPTSGFYGSSASLPTAVVGTGSSSTTLESLEIIANKAVAALTPRVSNVTATTASTALSWANVDVIELQLNASTTLSMAGALDGQKLVLEVIQGGGFTLTFPSNVAFSTELPLAQMVPSTAAGKRDLYGFIFEATTAKYKLVAFIAGF